MSYFLTLRSVRVKHKFKKKGNLDYLDWSQAWQLAKTIYPDAEYKYLRPKDPETGRSLERSYFTDGKTCEVKVKVRMEKDGVWHQVDLPIMDNRNNSITLDKVTSRDVNDSKQRALVKALAMHGLGLNAWTGEKDFISAQEFEQILESDNIQLARDVYQYCELNLEQQQRLSQKFKK